MKSPELSLLSLLWCSLFSKAFIMYIMLCFRMDWCQMVRGVFSEARWSLRGSDGRMGGSISAGTWSPTRPTLTNMSMFCVSKQDIYFKTSNLPCEHSLNFLTWNLFAILTLKVNGSFLLSWFESLNQNKIIGMVVQKLKKLQGSFKNNMQFKPHPVVVSFLLFN